jgi:hypothetical protein
MASLGGVVTRTGAALLRLAASRAFAICSRSALEAFGLVGVVVVEVVASVLGAGLVLAGGFRSAVDGVEILRIASVVFLVGIWRIGAGAVVVPGGDRACPYEPVGEGSGLGVRANATLVFSGRSFGVDWTLCAGASVGFLIVDTGRGAEAILLEGVATGVATGGAAAPLTLRLPGAVMDSRFEGAVSLLGVTGRGREAPSLVVGLLVLEDRDEAVRSGGNDLSALKKLERRRPFVPAEGDEGKLERLSMVRSDNEERDVLVGGESGSASGWCRSGEELLSWKPALEPVLEPVREEAREAELKPLRLPRTSVGVEALGVRVRERVVVLVPTGAGGLIAWWEGRRAKGLLKAGGSWEAVPLGRLAAGAGSNERLGLRVRVDGAAAAAAAALLFLWLVEEGTRASLEVLREREGVVVGAGAGAGAGVCVGATEESEGFERNWVVEAGARS